MTDTTSASTRTTTGTKTVYHRQQESIEFVSQQRNILQWGDPDRSCPVEKRNKPKRNINELPIANPWPGDGGEGAGVHAVMNCAEIKSVQQIKV